MQQHDSTAVDRAKIRHVEAQPVVVALSIPSSYPRRPKARRPTADPSQSAANDDADLRPADSRARHHRPRLCATIVDRLTFGGNIFETGRDAYRLASTRDQLAHP
jgi:hypothetical protein